MKLGMIFKIYGSYMQDDSWVEPDPAFTGEILVTDDNKVCGYCVDESKPGEFSVVYREKYIIGSLGITSTKKQGIAFYKFSDCPYYATKMYLVPDMENPDSAIWAEQNSVGTFLLQGMAKVKFQKIWYSEDKAREIKARFDQLSTLGYGQIQENIAACARHIANA